LLLGALAFWLFPRSEKVPEPTQAEPAEEARADEPEPEALPSPPPPRPTTSATRTVAQAAPSDALPPSHPITPERQRIQRQNQYIQVLNDAMDLRDGPKLRELALRFQEEGFVDTDKHGEGYLLVADCLERPGEASRAAAQAFWDRERGSTLRRHVKRHCLE
jgi:hypothetical protein